MRYLSVLLLVIIASCLNHDFKSETPSPFEVEVMACNAQCMRALDRCVGYRGYHKCGHCLQACLLMKSK